ncbi:hypothetical protein scyTo_0001119 [Scyliorhinus torazame]|uniref:Uncharacterized protein n=1 Tax=Scyliorhinus torazame TaxID=75743 RepID=A0A401P9I2_SCYTO|nr:hypothetical protein [Scyliorhinus torazame]
MDHLRCRIPDVPDPVPKAPIRNRLTPLLPPLLLLPLLSPVVLAIESPHSEVENTELPDELPLSSYSD